MKKKISKETAKKIAFYAMCGVTGFMLGRHLVTYGALMVYTDIARRGYHIADEAGNIVKMIDCYKN